MSIASMTRLAVERESPATPETSPPPRARTATATSDSNPKTQVQTALEAIASYIPSEALALHVAVLGIFAPSADGRWAALAVGLGSVVLFYLLGFFDREKPGKIQTQFWVLLALALLSFTTYAAALPGTPFGDVHPDASKVAGAVAIGLSLALPRLARIFKLRPT